MKERSIAEWEQRGYLEEQHQWKGVLLKTQGVWYFDTFAHAMRLEMAHQYMRNRRMSRLREAMGGKNTDVVLALKRGRMKYLRQLNAEFKRMQSSHTQASVFFCWLNEGVVFELEEHYSAV